MENQYNFMVFTELKKLFLEKEYRLFLILVLWLIIGFTLFQFPQIFPIELAFFIFPPIIGITTVLLIVSLIGHKDLREISYKKILFYCIIGIIIALLFTSIWQWIVGFLYRAGILSYIAITAIFYMYGCYNYGVKSDDKVNNLSSPINQILRWVMFLGGTFISIIIMIILSRIGIFWATGNPQIKNALALIPIIILILIIFLAIVGILTLLGGNLNAWLGIFFIFVSLYTIYLMVNAFYTVGSSGDTTYSMWTLIALYIFDLGLILYTISSMIGEKAEVISKKLKLKSETILLWLIFSKAAFELAKVADPRIQAGILNAVLGFLLFIPLLVIAGLYGIWNYGKINKESKSQNDEK